RAVEQARERARAPRDGVVRVRARAEPNRGLRAEAFTEPIEEEVMRKVEPIREQGLTSSGLTTLRQNRRRAVIDQCTPLVTAVQASSAPGSRATWRSHASAGVACSDGTVISTAALIGPRFPARS